MTTAVPSPTADDLRDILEGEGAVLPYGAVPLSTVSRDAPPPLIIERLDPAGHTILYGTGDTGKGVLTAHWIVQLAEAGFRTLIADYEGHAEEWARRVSGLGGREALESVVHVAPHGPDWTGPQGAIWDQQGALREIGIVANADILVVDSIVGACAGVDASTGDTRAPAQYGAAIQLIGLRTLSIAHVGRESNLRYPFGSVFWHDFARITWSLEKINAETGATLLVNRKHNNYERQPSAHIVVEWDQNLPRSVKELPYHLVLADRISEILSVPMTSKQIVTELNAEIGGDDKGCKSDSVTRALRRGVKTGRFTKDGDRYARAEDASPRSVSARMGAILQDPLPTFEGQAA